MKRLIQGVSLSQLSGGITYEETDTPIEEDVEFTDAEFRKMVEEAIE